MARTKFPHFYTLSIDPGANFGICIAKMSLVDESMSVLEATTLSLDEMTRQLSTELHRTLDKRALYRIVLRRVLESILEDYEIDFVVFESAYHSKSLLAYDSLVFYSNVIKEVVGTKDELIIIETVPPSVVKKTIGVKGNVHDKTLVAQKVFDNEDIILPPDFDYENAVEHTTDAIAIGFCLLKSICQNQRKV